MRRIAKVEDRLDVRRVEHRVVDGLKLLNARTDQLHDRVLVEARAFDVDRHPAAVAALVRRHVRDRHRQ